MIIIIDITMQLLILLCKRKYAEIKKAADLQGTVM